MVRKLLSGWLIVGAVLDAAVLIGWASGTVHPDRGAGQLLLTFTFLGWGLVYAVLGIACIVDAVRLGRAGDLESLQVRAGTVKLWAIPFFVLNFVVAASLAGAATVLGLEQDLQHGVGGPLLGLGLIVLTYLVLLPTSGYAIAAVLVLRNTGRLRPGWAVLTIVLHLLFVVDVFASVIVVEIVRRLRGEVAVPTRAQRQVLTVMFTVFSALAVIWGVVLGITAASPRDSPFATATGVLCLVPILALVCIAVIPVAPILTLRAAVQLYLADDLAGLHRLLRPIKIAPIPLFVQNFVLGTLLVLVATLLPVAASRGLIFFAGPLAIPIVGAFTSVGVIPAVVCTYGLMLPTSFFAFACLAVLLRRRSITPTFCTVQVILHLIFVADIVSTFVVAHRAGRVLASPDDR